MLLLVTLGLPACRRGEEARRDGGGDPRTEVFPPPSLTRLALPDVTRIEVSPTAVRCGGRLVAAISEEEGRRRLEPGAVLGGGTVGYLPELAACLGSIRAESAERVEDGADEPPHAAWVGLLADRRTPAAVLGPILETVAALDSGAVVFLAAAAVAPPAVVPGGLPATSDGWGAVILRGPEPGTKARCGGEGRCADDGPRLGLTLHLARSFVRVLVGSDVAGTAFSELADLRDADELELRHRAWNRAELAAARDGCALPTGGTVFDDCAYMGHLVRLADACHGADEDPVVLPDLKGLNLVLRVIRDNIDDVYGERLVDGMTVRIAAEEDVPLCALVAVLDFARLRDPWYDWTVEVAASAPADREEGIRPDAVAAEALFPAGLVLTGGGGLRAE